ncbi:NIPSNAP family protein [Maribellus mangrovi]|uniref:NIPSNAP family protein n=1 Tax=Maribellus mangrovi TaxID=3133146 RepID=UPI0030EC02EF
MKSKKTLFGIIVLTILFSSVSSIARDYYQIKIYTLASKAQESVVDDYLRDAYLPALHRAGIKTVGVFKPIEEDPAAGTKIFVFIPLKNLGQIESVDDKIFEDKEYLKNGEAYLDAKHDNPPFVRIESVLLRAFEKHPDFFVPAYKTPKSDQIFELRSYQGPTEKLWRRKVHMFNEGGECALFKKLQFNAVFYGEVISGSDMPNLMYMTSFPDKKSNDEHWEAFRNHPDWKTLTDKSEYANTVSHIDKWLCHPTAYSDI